MKISRTHHITRKGIIKHNPYKVKYKGKTIIVDPAESRYFMSFSTYPLQKAVEQAEAEMRKNPIITRYEVKKHTFEPTSAYTQGINYEVTFYYHKPKIDYFDYGTNILEARKYLTDFAKKRNTPLYPYPVSSVERNMTYSSLIGALMTVKASSELKRKIISIFKHRDKITPYTNWSGD